MMIDSNDIEIQDVLAADVEEVVDYEEVDEPELPVNIQSCLLLNNVYIESIDELKQYLQSKRRENDSRQLELQNNSHLKTVKDVTINNYGYSHPNSLIPFMSPYFKDVKGLSAPANADTLEKRSNGHINEAYVCQNKPWNVVERQKLKTMLMMDAMERAYKPLRDEKELLTRNKADIVKNLPRITELTGLIDNMSNDKNIPIPDRWDPSLDWLRFATELDTDHTADDCELYWNNFLHPLVSKTEWTKDEDNRLEKLVKKYGMRDWDRVSQELNTGRLAWQCCQRYQSELNRDLKRVGPLTKAEAETVEKVIDSCRVGDYIPWHQVKYFIEGRTLPQIKHYWNKINVVKRGDQWSDDENKVLMAAVKKYGTHNWRKVAQYIPGRSNRQCRERYMMRLNFGTDRKLGNWMPQEDKLILDLAPKCDFHWIKLENKIKGRNARQIASRYELLMKYNNVGKDVRKTKSKFGNKSTFATKTLTVRNRLYEKIRHMINRQQNSGNDNLDRILRVGKAKLAKKLELEKSGVSVTTRSGRPKKTVNEENIDAKITQLFAAYDHKSSPKKCVSLSPQDQCVYSTTKNVFNELITGTPFESTTELAETIRLVVNELVTGFPKNEINANSESNLSVDASGNKIMTVIGVPNSESQMMNNSGDSEIITTCDITDADMTTSRRHEWTAPPILPPNKATVKALRGLLIHSDYFSQIIARSEIPLEQFKEVLDSDPTYRKLFAEFKSLFYWPALLSMSDPPERSNRSNDQSEESVNGQRPAIKGRNRKSWLKNSQSRSRMIEIRTNQTKLIDSEMKRVANSRTANTGGTAGGSGSVNNEQQSTAADDNNEPLTVESTLAPWYVTRKDRRYYNLKSLKRDSFVFTRVRPKYSSIEPTGDGHHNNNNNNIDDSGSETEIETNDYSEPPVKVE
ncbi:uncharacterized protein LOC128962084 [Oppia nitens]|uniref:uncharacterized protein LOC128962084 n=1 Tax=Oppia nitens TaxID=1686743 RepID=UPI0023DA6D4F|nr:uncharacterized protein LOC128962084 [Oppia nitens]